MRTALRTTNEQIVRDARTLLDSLGDGLQLEADQYYAFLKLSKDYANLDAIGVPEITGEGHAANAGGPDTQHEAASLAYLAQKSVRRQIVSKLLIADFNGEVGLTDWQLEERLRVKHETCSAARNWLADVGWVVDSGMKRLRPQSGRRTIVWRLTDAALDQLRQEAQS